MRSPINWALLGLLIRRASYGYELVQRSERIFRETLELSSRSQIYTALDSLARRGLIEHARDARVRDPDAGPAKLAKLHYRIHYRATEAGIAAYERWLVEQVSDVEHRSHLIAQHFAALRPEHALRLLERCAEICLDAAGRLACDGAALPDGQHPDGKLQPQPEGALAERLAGEEVRLRTGAVLSWIDYARSELGAVMRTRSRTRR